jgi:secreted PhoX family phosphatase
MTTRRKFLSHLGATTLGTLAIPAAARLPGPSFTFAEVRRGADRKHHLPPGYHADVLLRWGDPLFDGLAPWRPGVAEPAGDPMRFGFNNDFVAYFPLSAQRQGSHHGLLCVNHEYVTPAMMWPADGEASAAARAQAELTALGHSVVEVRREAAGWRYRRSPRNRRTTGDTPVAITGPAAGHARLRSGYDPHGRTSAGILGACGGGKTPWGTVLIAEENFNVYFSGRSNVPRELVSQERYGVGRGSGFRHWAEHNPRFRADLNPGVVNGYGWIVELDPYDPARIAAKRTALGRCKHESANCVLAPDGRAVVYSGDDGMFEYIYRFVSADRFDPANREKNFSLLDRGTLSVARFADDGSLHWLDLVHGTGPLSADNGFADQADVLIDTRRAADLLGATRMDRPEEIETDPVTGIVYVMLTNNLRRAAGATNAANPRPHNVFGHILRLYPPAAANAAPDHAATDYRWDIALLAGNPRDSRHRASYPVPVSEDGWFAAPDNCAFDPRGRLWVATDQGRSWGLTGTADGLFACRLEAEGGGIRRFFRAPIGAEVCGPEFTPDGKTLFLAVQHPGVDGIIGASFDRPGTRWPDFDDALPARASVLAITRENGGPIGG